VKQLNQNKQQLIDRSTNEKIQSLYEKMDEIVEIKEEDEDDDPGPSIVGPLSDSLQGLFPVADDNEENEETKIFNQSFTKEIDSQKLFSNFKFFINREVPLEWMQLCIISFGGQVGWESPVSPYSIEDPGITHHVVDRPMQGHQDKTREYVQPQWVFDSINAQMILPVQKYLPGNVLPPHLSPFVDDKKEGYVPQYREEVLKLKSSVEVIKSMSSNISDASAVKIALTETLSDDEEEDETTYQRNVKSNINPKDKQNSNNTPEDIEDDSSAESIPDLKLNKGSKGVVLKPDVKSQTEVRLMWLGLCIGRCTMFNTDIMFH